MISASLLSACTTTVHTTYPGDLRMWDGIFARAEPFHFDVKPIAAVAPHHLIDAHELAGFWAELIRTTTPSTLVVIGPDHFLKGGGLSLGADVSFVTEYGPLRSSTLDGLDVTPRPQVFPGEHAMHVHSTYVKKLAPRARFIPLLATPGAPRAQLEHLAQQLHRLLPPDALVVASVDFSHYQPEPWASFHDEASFTTVQGFELDELFFREVDSPESLYVAMRFAQLRGAERAKRWLHTNSQRRRTPFVKDSTSHQYFTFSPGERAPAPSVNVTLTGDVPAGLGLVERWRWKPSALEHPSPVLSALRGQEDRFFSGSDLVLFDVAPGEERRRVVHGLTLVVRGLDLANAEGIAPSLPEKACLVLVAHRGTLPLDEAERRARLLTAHVVLGRGFGAPREVEWNERTVLALSLGDWAQGPTALAAGVTCTPTALRVRTVPLVVKAGVPQLDLEALGEELRPR